MKRIAILSALAMSVSTAALAADCEKVIFSDVGWTDITTTTATANAQAR